MKWQYRNQADGNQRPFRSRHWSWLQATFAGLSLAVVCSWATPTRAASRILITYGILERSIEIHDLETFVATGVLSPQLTSYAQSLDLSADLLQQIRQILVEPANMQAVAVSQFLYTEQGKLLLKQLSLVVQTPSRQGSVSAIRGGLILAASDPGGLTLLNVLKHYPIDTIRIDLAQGLAIAQQLERAVLQSETAISLVQGLSLWESANSAPVNLTAALGLVQAERRYNVQRLAFYAPGVLNPVDLYLPQPRNPNLAIPPGGYPMVLVSHGLGSAQESYTYLANYLASAGIAVATLEHAGSNDQQLMALLEGRSDSVVPDDEFLRRPRDVSRTIDALEQAQQKHLDFASHLNLNRIGVIGQSFGGYTALALAGATWDQESLGRSCPPGLLTFNLSLLLQCQAMRLGNPGRSLYDPRIQAVFVMNPVGSALFGQKGYSQINVPLFIVSGAADTVAPAFPEQIQPFTWLTTPERYLLLVGQGTHFSAIGDVGGENQPIAIPPTLVGPDPPLVQSYMQILTVAFFKQTLEGKTQFQPLLQASFVEQLGKDPHPLSLTQTMTMADLEEALKNPISTNGEPLLINERP